MVKTVHFKVSDETYYKLIELKGKLKASDWTDFLDKVIQIVEKHEK